MLTNYLLTALRNIRRRPGYTLINVAGLGLGIASCLVIFLVVKYELGYDRFNSKAGRIYRVNLHALDYNPRVSPAVTPALRNDFPELQTAELFYDNGMVTVGTARYNEKNYAFADEYVPRVFDYQWLAGDSRSALSAPNSVVLTESMAVKYFGKEDPMGKVLQLDNQYTCKVTGVIKDLPGNTSLPFPFLVSMATIRQSLDQITAFYAIPDGNFTFVLLPENYPVDRVNSRIHSFIEKNWGKDIAREATLILQPLRDVHFDQRYLYITVSQTTSRQTYWALAGIALFIIVTACINFINLATGQAVNRAREVGVRKVLGAYRLQLIGQFLGETAVLVVLAVGLGMSGAALLLPRLSDWLDIRISADELTKPGILGMLAVLTGVIVLLAGLYPAFVQAAFRPAVSLKGKVQLSGPSGRGLTLRRSLVVVQFAISQLLIAGTIIVARQMDYFENRDLGFNKESVISFDIPDSAGRRALRQQLAANPGVSGFSFSSGAPGYNNGFAGFSAPEYGLTKDDVTEYKMIDENYIRLFGLRMLAGDTIARRPGRDSILRTVVNETLVHKLNIEDPHAAIGARFDMNGNTCTIVGVVEDFQSETKHKKRRACVLYYDNRGFFDAGVRINPAGMRRTISDIEKGWTALFPNFVFQYEFLDDHIASLYRQEEKVYTAFRIFACIAILIGCMGLYGLIAFATLQRTREVGIRKVLGASVPQIVYLFNREFILLILLAFIIAAPVAWLAMNSWLDNFAYRIGIGWGTFVISLAVSFCIAAVTISYKSLVAAWANPVKSLRAE